MRIENIKPIKWTEKPKLLSLFSGCGGMDLPFHRLDYKSVWAIDTNRHACDTYARNIAPVIVNDSIENIDQKRGYKPRPFRTTLIKNRE